MRIHKYIELRSYENKTSTSTKVTGQKLPDNKPPRIIEEIIVKYAVDPNLFRLGSTNPKISLSIWSDQCGNYQEINSERSFDRLISDIRDQCH